MTRGGLLILIGVVVSSAGCNVTWPMLNETAVYDPVQAMHGRAIVYAPPNMGRAWSQAKLADATPEELVYVYAPILVQGQQVPGEHDRTWSPDSDAIGRAYLHFENGDELKTHVDVAQPTVYAIVKKRLLGTREHVQLTYVVWYPRRPQTKAIDIEAANIDSGIVRITLDDAKLPLFYETVLACGCYHKAFVEQRVESAAWQTLGPPESGKTFATERNVPRVIDWEVAGVVNTPSDVAAPPVLFVSAGEHRMQGVQSSAHFNWPTDPSLVRPYRLADYRELDTVQIAGTPQLASIFNPDNDEQVLGADRLEKYIFMWIGTDDAGHPRKNDEILLHFDQSRWMDPDIYERFLRLPPGLL